ncbi:maleylpyruvate isomerase family mycothiol-dependent enzyme [Pseudonocardia hispaniensis]|uniref:Maleylpyruvate isomerase family mycothiol-dependent enzyme n=1 Tax=Pseudonocardia hispaniensis TaxID=904933 RepID=A0ABW1J9P3_9PSEU
MTDLDLDHRAAFLDQTALFAELTRTADPQAPVPTCPGWTIRNLITHVGRGERWSATIVRTRASEPVDPRTVADGKPPADADGAATWLRDGAADLLAAVDGVGAQVPVWTFTGPRPAEWWIRRRLHEVVAHRADAALALGVPYDLAPELAADAVSEWLDLLTVPRREAGEPPLSDGATMHLHATDEGLGAAGEWMVRPAGERIAWEHGHAKGTVAVRGAASDLFLALLRRIPAEPPRVEVLGDREVLARFLARTPF